MAVRQYIGARYTTKVYENTVTPGSAEWQANVTYEPLTLVTYNNSSYLSKKTVPGSVGNPASNPDYWVVTGDYNGQIATLNSAVNNIDNVELPAIRQDISDLFDDAGYEYYGILRCTSDGWKLLDEPAHRPKNMSNLSISPDGRRLSLDTTSDNSTIGTFIVVPDEVFSNYGMRIGAAVNYHSISIEGVWDYDYFARVTGTFSSPALDAAKSMDTPVGDAGTSKMRIPYTAIADIVRPQIAVVNRNLGMPYNVYANRPIENDGYIHVRFYNPTTDAEVIDPPSSLNFSVWAHSSVTINWNTIADNYASWMDTAAIFIYGKNK